MIASLAAPAPPSVWAARLALAAWAALTAWVALVGPGDGKALLAKDELDHVVFVGGLALLSGCSFPQARIAPLAVFWALPCVGAELAQAALAPDRMPSLHDVTTSYFGAVLGLAALGYVRIAAGRR